jgi:hypothetical protein
LAHACVPVTGEVGGSQFKDSLGKVSVRPYLKEKLKAKGLGDMSQVVECLASMKP